MTAYIDEDKACKIIICGSRTFDDFALLCRKMNKLTSKITRPLIAVSGTAKGADLLGEKWFWELPFERRLLMKRFHPDWDRLGKKAGVIRNQEMVDYADRLVAFWDGKSPGTKDCIERARKKGIKVKVIQYEQVPAEGKKTRGRGQTAPADGRVQKRAKRNLFDA